MANFKIWLKGNVDSRDFVCDICGHCLSVPPILFHKSVGKICGRCFENGETEKFDCVLEKQVLYENFAKYFSFPCSYRMNGCNEELKWGSVTDHENGCEYKKIKCPLPKAFNLSSNEICDWIGDKEDLISHLETTSLHAKYFQKSLFINICFDKTQNQLVFSQIRDKFVAVVLQYDEGRQEYFLNLLMDQPLHICKNYKYDLEIFYTDEHRRVVLAGNQVEPFCESMIRNSYFEKGLKLNLCIIETFFGPPKTFVRLLFKLFCNGEYINDLTNKDKDVDKPSTLQEYEFVLPPHRCDCGLYLIPPIYICTNGHNFCNKNKSGYCCKCKLYMKFDKNALLETFSTLMMYSCLNKSSGCDVKLHCEQIKVHEENCQYTPKNCIFNCSWNGTNGNMLNHIKEKHQLLKMKHIHFSRAGQERHVLSFDGNIFLLTIKSEIFASLFVRLQCLGMTQLKYSYQFTLLSSCNDIKLVAHNLCQPLLYGEDKKEIPTPLIEYPFNFYCHFITEHNGEFNFTIDITKLGEQK